MGSLVTDFLPRLGSKVRPHCLPSCPDSGLFSVKAWVEKKAMLVGKPAPSAQAEVCLAPQL